jgi:uncharacterized MAPEG superfamily protein
MKLELTLLVCAVGLAFVQVLVALLTAIPQVGLPALLGNREEMPALTGVAGRAERAYKNMFESLLLFAALVLVAAVAGKTNAQTALGAQIFVWARLAFAVIYVVGIPVVRTLAWLVGVIGLLIIGLQLV